MSSSSDSRTNFGLFPSLNKSREYCSSSFDKEFIKEQKENTDNFVYEILNVYDNKKEMIDKEIELHTYYNVSSNELFYNRSHQTSKKFSTHGMVKAKDENNNIVFINVNDERLKTGELKAFSSGKVTVKDKYNNKFVVSTEDERLKTGELKAFSSGMTTVKDKNGNTLSVSVNDPRYLSGELVGVMKGLVSVKDKDGNKMVVSKNDPRYLSGELVSTRKKSVS